MVEWILSYFSAVLGWWYALIPGVLMSIVDVIERSRGKEAPLRPKFVIYLLLMGFMIAQALAWRDEHAKAQGEATYMQVDTSLQHPPEQIPIFRAGSVPSINLGLANTGAYLAEDVVTVTGLESYDLTLPFNADDPSRPVPTGSDIEDKMFEQMKKDKAKFTPSKTAFTPGEHRYVTANYTHPLDQPEADSFRTGHKMMYVLGFTKWKDAGGAHEWRHCSIVKPPADSNDVTENCITHNDFLRKAED
jgi:hypothetical protein